MGRPVGKGRITTSVTLTPKFFELAKQNRIGFSEAMRVGLSLAFAERGIMEYDNRLNLHRKMIMFQKKAEELSKELEQMKEKLKSFNK